MNYSELARSVTARLIEMIETGPGVWRMPWHVVPGVLDVRNAATGARYAGINTMTLAVAAFDAGYPSGWWSTYKQWVALGAQVRQGERAARIVKWVPGRPAAADTHEDDANEGGHSAGRLIPKVYPVFNVAQVDGWDAPALPLVDDVDRDEQADAWISATGAEISFGHDHSCYRPGVDRIELPDRERFTDPDSFFGTACHELVHWTGSPARLNRDLSGRFGSDAYAAEELVAELGAAIACAHLQISPTPRQDHAAYLASWLAVLRADPTALFTVAAKAQTAVDHLDRLATKTTDATGPLR